VKSPETNVFSADFIRYLHHEFYSHISQEEWVSFSHDGQKYPITPGAFRDHPVSVGSHVPPDHEKLNLFLQRFESEYSSGRIYETNKLIAIAASHHRLAWIHPFADGNGRVIRLQSQAALIQSGVDADGLWTLSRSLARNKEDYYRLLQNADQGRRNDLDGRGNLSDKALLEFCTFFLEQALDQIEFMMGLLAPNELLGRIERYFKVEYAECEDKDRERLARLISELCLKGEIPRGDVPAIIGLKDSAAREIIRHALEDEIIVSPSPKGILQINFPLKVRETFFPRLFTDLSAN
jgi:Fic family protein